jgi:hypothetical protein
MKESLDYISSDFLRLFFAYLLVSVIVDTASEIIKVLIKNAKKTRKKRLKELKKLKKQEEKLEEND